ncbi:MAG: GGDEF domain-containing protein [Aquificaceae bacterium]|nr:GGDEF domain-containing protein [Aquificaceae bacterium]
MNSLKNLASREFLSKLEIRPYYQPIVDLRNGRPLGFEALSRFKIGEAPIGPLRAFQMASDFDVVGELDTLCREVALMHFPKDVSGYIFLNVFPSYLTSESFGKRKTLELVKSFGLEPISVVLELTEVERVQDVDLLKKALNYYKSLGFLVGIDDVGTGYNSLQMLLELEGLLDFVKLPKELVNGFARSKIKYQLLKVLTEVSLNIGAKPIYEGVEQEEDAKLLFYDLDAQYVQGFYFAKPMSSEELKGFVVQTRFQKNSEDFVPEGEVLEYVKYDPKDRFGKFLELFDGNGRRYFILHLDDEEYLIDMWRLRYELTQKEINLYYYKPLSEVVQRMKSLFPRLDGIPHVNAEIHNIHRLFDVVASQEHDVVLYKKNNRAYLLEKYHIISYFYRRLSKELLDKNPLTLLPGSNALQEKVKKLSSSENNFFLCYIDLDNFKAFNDAYGFYAGDQMIKKVGVILSSFERKGEGRIFVSHIGGDDFVLVLWDTTLEEAVQELLKLLSDLQDGLLELYSHEDRARGYFVGKDRHEVQREFPLASVSMALVKGSSDMVEISKRCAQLKKRAKSHVGSVLVVEGLNEILTIDR